MIFGIAMLRNYCGWSESQSGFRTTWAQHISITMDTYSHVLARVQEEAAAKMNLALKAAIEKEQKQIM